MSGGRYIQNQQLEDLRNLHESFTKEQHRWNEEKETREKATKKEENRIREERVSQIRFLILF